MIFWIIHIFFYKHQVNSAQSQICLNLNTRPYCYKTIDLLFFSQHPSLNMLRTFVHPFSTSINRSNEFCSEDGIGLMVFLRSHFVIVVMLLVRLPQRRLVCLSIRDTVFQISSRLITDNTFEKKLRLIVFISFFILFLTLLNMLQALSVWL